MTGRDVLRVTVTARQRLALGIGSEVSYFTGTHKYAPGTVLRGALAAAWIAENGPPGTAGDAAAFRELFDGPIRYGPLFVPSTVVIPVSARVCKYPRHEGCEEQAVDAAFETASRCPACTGPLEPGKGQVILPGDVSLERVTRTSISPETGKAVDGELYAHGALPAGTTLTGYIYGRASWLEDPRRLRLGGRRTVSGAADYQAAPLQPGDEDRLPGEWPGLAAASGGEPLSPDRARLVIRLASPAVLIDAAACPSLEPDPVLDLGGAEVGRRWVRPLTWSGWHAASRLPKPDEICADIGSTYEITGPASLLRELAERLPWEGIGLRRNEGFGEVRIAQGPWRPPAPVASRESRPASGTPESTPDMLARWLADLRKLALEPAQLRWVTDALRELQLARELQTADSEDPIGELLKRAAAGGFSGRQRQGLTVLLSEPDPRQLRDLTMLLLAEQAAGSEGGSR